MSRARATVAALLADARSALAAAGVENAAAEAAWLLAHSLGVERAWLGLHPEHEPAAEQRAAFHALLSRRVRREPLQYILGSQPFCGLEIRVDRRVLIPRPETELLVKAALEALAARGAAAARAVRGGAGGGAAGPRIADVGTGSGCIAVALAVRLPQAAVHAVDVSPGALAVAAQNARLHGVADRLSLQLADVLHEGFALPPPPFDAIVSNPPYVAAHELATLQPEVREHEPPIALAPHPHGPDGPPGDDALVFYRRLGALAAAHLRAGGFLAVEVAAGRAAASCAAISAAARGALGEAELRLDAAGEPRIALLRRREG